MRIVEPDIKHAVVRHLLYTLDVEFEYERAILSDGRDGNVGES